MKKTKKILLLLSMIAIMLITSLSAVFAADVNSFEFSTGCNLSQGESKIVPLFIKNDDLYQHDYSLTTGGYANNYELYFAEGGVSVKTVTIPAGANAQIDLNITLKANPSLNVDKLVVKAVRDDKKENIMNLSILVNNDYKLSVSSMLNKIDTLSGKSAEFTFSVTNNGSKDLNSVKLKSELPDKWIVSQGTKTINNLKPGETGTLKATIEVPSSQTAGNFAAKFVAMSDETSSSQISVPITVKTSSNMAIWMIGILILIAGLTLVQFKKHGRR